MKQKVLIRPGPGRIAIIPVDSSQEHQVQGTSISLWIPQSSTHEGQIGRVVATCDPYQSDAGVTFSPNYDVGNLVIIGKFTGTRLNIGRETYTILHESDVLASIEVEDVSSE